MNAISVHNRRRFDEGEQSCQNVSIERKGSLEYTELVPTAQLEDGPRRWSPVCPCSYDTRR